MSLCYYDISRWPSSIDVAVALRQLLVMTCNYFYIIIIVIILYRKLLPVSLLPIHKATVLPTK